MDKILYKLSFYGISEANLKDIFMKNMVNYIMISKKLQAFIVKLSLMCTQTFKGVTGNSGLNLYVQTPLPKLMTIKKKTKDDQQTNYR